MISDTSFALWPIPPFGGEGEDGGDNGGADGGDNGGAGATDDDTKAGAVAGDSGAEGADDDDDDEDDEDLKGLSAAELRKIASDNKKAAAKAEKERLAAQEVIDKQERAKNDKATNLEKDLNREREITKTLRATISKQAIESAIRDDERWEFHDVEMVAGVAVQLNPDITVSDKGKVEGLKATLAKIAKQHEFMVKRDKTKDVKQQQNNGNGPTGFQPGQGGTSGGAGDDVDKAALAVHYPALATARV